MNNVLSLILDELRAVRSILERAEKFNFVPDHIARCAADSLASADSAADAAQRAVKRVNEVFERQAVGAALSKRLSPEASDPAQRRTS